MTVPLGADQPSPRPTAADGDRRLLAVLINWHEQDQTIECLRNLRAQAVPGMALLVVDNEGTAQTQAAFDNAPDAFDYYHRFEENVGFTGACNYGLDLANELGFRQVLWFNNDAEARDGCLARLLEVIESDPKIAMVSPVLRNRETGRAHFCGARLDRSEATIHYLSFEELSEAGPDLDCYLYGTALMARVDVVKQFGGFCSKYFIYREDLELCDRVLSAGYHCRMVVDASVDHINQHSDESGTVRSKYFYYYSTRNEIDFWWKVVSGKSRARALYWHWHRTRRRIAECKRLGRTAEANALRHGLIDGILGRYGRWRLHPAKSS